MIYKEPDFIKAIEQSFKAYKEKGARSTAKNNFARFRK
jgi:hypothetical protein